jgi:TolA-binding protein
MKNKIISRIISLLAFILAINLVLAVCPDPSDLTTCPLEERPWESLTPEQKFQVDPQRAFTDNPTAANLLRPDVPKTLSNFQILSPADQRSYLTQNYDEQFAEDYLGRVPIFTDSQDINIGKRYLSERTSFAGNDERIVNQYMNDVFNGQNYIDAQDAGIAESYFSQRLSNLESIKIYGGYQYRYDQGTGDFHNGEAWFNLNSLESRTDIRSITTVRDGFIFLFERGVMTYKSGTLELLDPNQFQLDNGAVVEFYMGASSLRYENQVIEFSDSVPEGSVITYGSVVARISAPNAKINFEDNTAVFENMQVESSHFQAKGKGSLSFDDEGILTGGTIEAYGNGRQTSIFDYDRNVEAETVGYNIQINIGQVPSVDELRKTQGDQIFYTKQGIATHGAVFAKQRDFSVVSKDHGSFVADDGKITYGEGKAVVEDRNTIIDTTIYKGSSPEKIRFVKERVEDKDSEFFEIDGPDGDIAKVAQKIYLQADTFASGVVALSGEKHAEFLISSEQGELRTKMLTASLSRPDSSLNNENPDAVTGFIDINLFIKAGESTSAITKGSGHILFEDENGKQLKVVPAGRQIFGDKAQLVYFSELTREQQQNFAQANILLSRAAAITESFGSKKINELTESELRQVREAEKDMYRSQQQKLGAIIDNLQRRGEDTGELQYEKVDYTVKQHLVDRDYDKAIGEFNSFIQTPDGQRFEGRAKLNIGNLQHESGNTQQAIKTLQDVRERFPEQKTEASFSLGRVYIESGELDKAENIYHEVISESPNAQQKSQAYLGIALAQFQRGPGNLRFSLRELDKALKEDPTNEGARRTLQQMQVMILRQVNTALGGDAERVRAAFEGKLGIADYEGSFWDNVKQVWSNTGTLILTHAGYAESLQLSFGTETHKIDAQQAGIMTMQLAIETGKYTLQDFDPRKTTPDRYLDIIKEVYGELPPKRQAFFLESVNYAVQNSDVTLAMQNGQRTESQAKAYQEALKKGGYEWAGFSYEQAQTAGTVSDNFRFLTGEGYTAIPEALQKNWRDVVTQGANIKNLVMFTLPMAKFTSAFSVALTGGRLASSVAQAPTVASALVGGLAKIPGIKTAVDAAQASRVYTGYYSAVNQMSWAGRFLTPAAIETTIGYGVGQINPELGMFVDMSLGVAGTFSPTRLKAAAGSSFISEVTERAAKSYGDEAAEAIGKALAANADEIAETTSREVLEGFVARAAKNANVDSSALLKSIDIDDAIQAAASKAVLEANQQAEAVTANAYYGARPLGSQVDDASAAAHANMKASGHPGGRVQAEVESIESVQRQAADNLAGQGRLNGNYDLKGKGEAVIDGKTVAYKYVDADGMTHQGAVTIDEIMSGANAEAKEVRTLLLTKNKNFLTNIEEGAYEVLGRQAYYQAPRDALFDGQKSLADMYSSKGAVSSSIAVPENPSLTMARQDFLDDLNYAVENGLISKNYAKHVSDHMEEGFKLADAARKSGKVGGTEADFYMMMREQGRNAIYAEGGARQVADGVESWGRGATRGAGGNSVARHGQENFLRQKGMMDAVGEFDEVDGFAVWYTNSMHDAGAWTKNNNVVVTKQFSQVGDQKAAHKRISELIVEGDDAARNVFGQERLKTIAETVADHDTVLVDFTTTTNTVKSSQGIADNFAGVGATSGGGASEKGVQFIQNVPGNEDVIPQVLSMKQLKESNAITKSQYDDFIEGTRQRMINNVQRANIPAAEKRAYLDALNDGWEGADFFVTSAQGIYTGGKFTTSSFDEAENLLRVTIERPRAAAAVRQIDPTVPDARYWGALDEYAKGGNLESVSYRLADGTDVTLIRGQEGFEDALKQARTEGALVQARLATADPAKGAVQIDFTDAGLLARQPDIAGRVGNAFSKNNEIFAQIRENIENLGASARQFDDLSKSWAEGVSDFGAARTDLARRKLQFFTQNPGLEPAVADDIARQFDDASAALARQDAVGAQNALARATDQVAGEQDAILKQYLNTPLTEIPIGSQITFVRPPISRLLTVVENNIESDPEAWTGLNEVPEEEAVYW